MEDIDIKTVFWGSLIQGDNPQQKFTDRNLWGSLYDHGFVDPRRVPKKRWMDILKQLPSQGGRYAISPQHVEKLHPFLYSGPIKRPFDPIRLKDGPRPVHWIMEMYQKVLKFETDIKAAEWNAMVQNQLNPVFLEGDHYFLDQDFKEVLWEILEERASPLRKLELWVFASPPGEAPKETVTASPSPPSTRAEPVRDSFEKGPEEIKKIRSIEKLYFHGEKPPPVDDQEALSFLEGLEDLEDEGEEIK